MKQGIGIEGEMWGDYIHLKGVAEERKGNVQALRLWDTLPTCLGWQNLFKITSYKILFYVLQRDLNLLHIENPLDLLSDVF